MAELTRRQLYVLAAVRAGCVSGSHAHGRWRFADRRDGRACTGAIHALVRAGHVHIEWGAIPGEQPPVVTAP